jgi:hypothetical protein
LIYGRFVRTAYAVVFVLIAPSMLLGLLLGVPVAAVYILVTAILLLKFGHYISWEICFRRLISEAVGRRVRFRLRKTHKLPYGYRFVLVLPVSVDGNQLVKKSDALSQHLGIPLRLFYSMEALEIDLGDRKTFSSVVRYGDFYRNLPAIQGELVFGIGRTPFGSLYADLASLPHVLIGGLTGSGKTAFLRQMLVWLCETNAPTSLKIFAIDMKGTELTFITDLPHLAAYPAFTYAEAVDTLESLVEELHSRRKLFGEVNSPDIELYRSRTGTTPHRIILVSDELAELTGYENQRGFRGKRRAIQAISTLARLGRAFGIHLVLATQRPDAEVLPGQIKANLPATMAFRCRSEVNSRILLGEQNSDAAHLPPVPGRGIWQHERNELVQAVYLDYSEAEKRINKIKQTLQLGVN